MSERYIVAQLNARVMPLDRGAFFEELLDAVVRQAGVGEVTGGGTMQLESGEIEFCDIEVEVTGDLATAERIIIDALDALGAPKGSILRIEADGRTVPFGSAEGLAVYLNGTDLPDEVYRDCDSNFVYSEFERLLEGEGRVLSHWQGPTETALYAYGRSFEAMRERLAGFIATYPLCQRCRLVQVA